MKYIRTKDGRILNKSKIICSAFREEYISPDWNDDIEKYLQTKIVAESDTIEELCDAFVLGNKPLPIIWSKKALEKDIMPKLKYHVEKSCEVYGAIWTDKGLIYVAKMNEKGELCLL